MKIRKTKKSQRNSKIFLRNTKKNQGNFKEKLRIQKENSKKKMRFFKIFFKVMLKKIEVIYNQICYRI